MKKLGLFLALLIIYMFVFSASVYANEQPTVELDSDRIENGVIGIKVNNIESQKIKVLIQLDNNKIYYDISNGEEFEYFPLQLGNGNYKIAVLKNLEGNKYGYVFKEYIDVNIEDEKLIFLNSIKIVDYKEDMESVKQAEELIKDLETSLEKVQAVYDYIITNISYDKDKVNLSSDYTPNITEIFEEQKAICYDYASIFGAMLRSQGIPTKLVKGYSEYTTTYHAWNEVYIEELDEWVVIDCTKGAVYYQAGYSNEMIEEESKYEIKYVY